VSSKNQECLLSICTRSLETGTRQKGKQVEENSDDEEDVSGDESQDENYSDDSDSGEEDLFGDPTAVAKKYRQEVSSCSALILTTYL